MISLNEFKKIELKTAKIIAVEDIEGKDKLYKLTVDLGKEKKTLVAGIKPYYTKDELKGKTIVVVANLEPAKIAGTESQGMLLAAKALDDSYAIVTIDKEVNPGITVE